MMTQHYGWDGICAPSVGKEQWVGINYLIARQWIQVVASWSDRGSVYWVYSLRSSFVTTGVTQVGVYYCYLSHSRSPSQHRLCAELHLCRLCIFIHANTAWLWTMSGGIKPVLKLKERLSLITEVVALLRGHGLYPTLYYRLLSFLTCIWTAYMYSRHKICPSNFLV